VFHSWDDQSTIKEVIPLFAGCFCKQHAAMTCRSMQVAMLMLTLWVVLRTGEPDIQQKCAGDEGRAININININIGATRLALICPAG
jgi:hypothetical protein